MSYLADDTDTPLVFYHGTCRVFERFQPNACGLIHFSQERAQAEEFAQEPRGDRNSLLGEPRVIAVNLRAERVFDCTHAPSLASLADDLDWSLVIAQAEDLSQSPWTEAMARQWLSEGAWQILELPCVLEKLREGFDGVAMRELGARNIAVFSADQVHILWAGPVVEARPKRKPGI